MHLGDLAHRLTPVGIQAVFELPEANVLEEQPVPTGVVVPYARTDVGRAKSALFEEPFVDLDLQLVADVVRPRPKFLQHRPQRRTRREPEADPLQSMAGLAEG